MAANPPNTSNASSWRASVAAPRGGVTLLEPRRVLDAAGLLPGESLSPDPTVYAAPELPGEAVAAAPTAVAMDWSTVAAEAPTPLLAASLVTQPSIDNLLVTSTDEGGFVALTGAIAGPPGGDPLTLTIDWGDGTVETVSAPPGPFNYLHTYADDNPTGTSQDTVSVTVSLSDPSGVVDTEIAPTTVRNIAPQLSAVSITAIDENGVATLTGSVTDPGTQDSFTLTIDWGDGSAPQLVSLAAGATSFSVDHQYLDDDPTGTSQDSYKVSVAIADDDSGLDLESTTAVVANVAPTLSNLAVTSVNENGVATLTGTITDPGSLDTFTLTIDWGDGSAAQVVSLAAGATSFSVNHQYLDDNPTGTPQDNYTVGVSLADDDTGNAMGSVVSTVTNVAPTISNLAVTSVNENGVATLTGSIIDPGTLDSFTLTIDWGDGSAAQVVSLAAGATSFSVNHQYLDDNPAGTSQDNYTVGVSLADDDTGNATGSVVSTVTNVAPIISNLAVTSVNENGIATLTGTITDPGSLDTFTLTIDWGDGSAAQVVNLAAGATSFSVNHQYLDDNPTGTPQDNYTVGVSLADDDTGNANGSVVSTVTNVAPIISNLAVTSVNENGVATLTGSIIDPGTLDSFTLTIDWGDGSAAQVVNLAAGATSFSVDHQYLDDNPTGTPQDNYTVGVSLADDDTGNALGSVVSTVTNVAPIISNLAVTSVNENGVATLTGSIIDPGTLDSFTLTIDWGDGSAAQVVNLAAGATSFSVDHQYLDDNPTGTPQDNYTVGVSLADDDTGNATGSVVSTVTNVAPTISNLAVTSVNENGIATLTGSIIDPGTLDSFTLTIDWGDGSAAQVVNLAAGTTSFLFTHLYVDDDPTGTPSDSPTVTVTIRDDDTGQNAFATSPTITNVPPTIVQPLTQDVAEGQAFTLAGLLGSGGLAFGDVGVNDTHTATIDWGDGTAVEALAVSFAAGAGTLDGGHTYADNGLYTATITVTDDDTGTAVRTITFRVANVDPVLTGTAGLAVSEGAAVTLSGLGVGVSDPGFDNPLNTVDPANGGELAETFVDGQIDWGDGSATTPVTFGGRISGSPGVTTIATPSHAAHHYADNGVYTVRVTFADDDGAPVTRDFQVTVNNVAPTLTLNDPGATLNEGQTLTLPLLGTFTDPGFDNLLNPNGASTERFTYTINWGDGTVETLQLPSSLAPGGPNVLTTGTLAASHLYADNDVDNRYTITVTLTDDDGGTDERSFDVTVLNVAPTLQPIAATDLEGAGVTTLTLTFSDPGADTFEILVDWGDKPDLAPEDRYVVSTLHAGPTPQTFVLTYQYNGPPDPLNPSADITIRVKVRDDDFATASTLVVGESNVEEVTIDNPGIDENKVAIDTTPQAPPVEFPAPPTVVRVVERAADSAGDQRPSDLGGAGGNLAATSERYLELRVLRPDGVEGDGIRLKENALDDLPGLFGRLPDGRYRIYVVQTETDTRRLVIDVSVRGGRLIDPSDDSDGGRDRPPGAESPSLPALERAPTPQATTDRASFAPDPPATPHRGAQAASLVLLTLARPKGASAAPRPGEKGWDAAVERALARGPVGGLRRIRGPKPR